MKDHLTKLQSLLADIERLGEDRKKLLIKKVLCEATLNDAEDKIRELALTSDLPVTRIPLMIKNGTQVERRELHKAESNYRVCAGEYEMTIEILNAVKFEVMLTEMLGG